MGLALAAALRMTAAMTGLEPAVPPRAPHGLFDEFDWVSGDSTLPSIVSPHPRAVRRISSARGTSSLTRDPKACPVLTAAAVLALCTGLAAACAAATVPGPGREEPSVTAASASDTTVWLRIGESVTVPESGAVVTLDDVTDDSRCPTDATCVWAGDAVVRLSVRSGAGRTGSVALHVSMPGRRVATTAGLTLALDALEPAPTAGQTIERGHYRARIAITSQQQLLHEVF